MIELSSITSALIRNEDVIWALTSNLIKSSVQEDLIKAYPQHGFSKAIRDKGTKKHYSFNLLDLVLNNNIVDDPDKNVDEIWYKFANILLTDEYIELISKKMNINLKDASINIGFYKFNPGDWVEPHIDNPNKLVTQIFYFNEFWDYKWGGYLKLLNSKNAFDEYFSVPPLINYTAILTRSNSAWHMVTPVNDVAKTSRLSMQLEFIDPTVNNE